MPYSNQSDSENLLLKIEKADFLSKEEKLALKTLINENQPFIKGIVKDYMLFL